MGTLAPERPPAAPEQPGNRPRPLASLPVLRALLMVTAAVVAGGLLLIPQPPNESSADVGFARDMSRHHLQAVTMAEAVRARTVDPELRSLTQDIALTQQAQVGMMTAWLELWGYTANGSGPAMAWMGMPTEGLMPGMATPEEVAALSTLPIAEAEEQFLALMVAHHSGGVSMAEGATALADRPEVVSLAQGIAAAQSSEIEYLQSLLARRGLAPAPVPTPQTHDLASGHHAAGGSNLADVLLWSLVTLGLVAFLWLLLDTAVRGTGRAHQPVTAAALVLMAGAVVSSAIHFVLTPSHAEQSPAYGAFFVFSALALAAGTATVLVGRRDIGAVLVAVVGVLLVVTYVLFRVVPPPGAAEPEGVDAWGLAAVAAELLMVAAAAILLRSRRLVASGA